MTNQHLFGSLEFGALILFVICYLVLGIFYSGIQLEYLKLEGSNAIHRSRSFNPFRIFSAVMGRSLMRTPVAL